MIEDAGDVDLADDDVEPEQEQLLGELEIGQALAPATQMQLVDAHLGFIDVGLRALVEPVRRGD